ncbi:FMN-dependent NADH-azoreductase [Pseudomonas turukhanskensis]|uniref:FMN dependent NADH:quinone oxidoreductase n=1 Tax=Pseudomonas turukhanskensis TaxID=1806536 RepID=A0A9W6NFY8_9PSED|nr:NAD(P)H-dependent oxidoreductase [Pseudomonas turukhanskensis]GLK90219.1 FMN-dependent NADH-azoreductase [Pseudomonas turukhanskensis]
MTSSHQPHTPLRVLRLVASPRGAESQSLQLSQQILFALATQAGRRGIELTDLNLTALPPVDAPYTHALAAPGALVAMPAAGALSRSDHLISQLQACDVLLIATPMHNYSVPSGLKAWIDHVVRVGKTFIGTPKGKQGTLNNRPVYVAVSAGGYISGERARQPDFLRPYLTAVLATIGLEQVQYFTVEGTAKGPEALHLAHAEASEQVQAFFSGSSCVTGLRA